MADRTDQLPLDVLMFVCISLLFFSYSHEILERHSTECRNWFRLRSPFTEPPNNRVARIWSYILRSIPPVTSTVCMSLEIQPMLTRTPWLTAEGNACWAQGQARALDSRQFMNPDIGGIGVHLGLIILPWTSIGALIYGHSHGCESGIKELCIQNLVSKSVSKRIFLAGADFRFDLIYLVINIAFDFHKLTLPELLTACASIDCVGAAVSMSFSDKRVLASRRLVYTCVVVQLLAFAVSAKALYGLRASDQAMLDLCEFHMFWLVPFASNNVPRGFWLHFAWRLLVWAHNAYLGLLFAGSFHRADHISRKTLKAKLKDAGYTVFNARNGTDSSLEENPTQNRNISTPVENFYCQYEFDRLPATVFTKYLEHAFTILVASVSMHGLARDFGGKSKLQHMDWGQRAPLIVCLIGIIHYTYVQARNFGNSSLQHLWEVELVTGKYPNSPDHPDDYPPWARPTAASVWSLRFWQHLWRVVMTQRKLSTLLAPNYPRCRPINPTKRLNLSWWDIWKNPFPESIPLTEEHVKAETRRLWAQFDLLGPSGIREALLSGAKINHIHVDDNRTVLLRLLDAKECHTRIVALALLMEADTNITLPKNNSGIIDATPLVVASGRGHANAACYLLDYHPSIHDAATALISAARSAHSNVVGFLISRGLGVDVKCPSTGETALITAARNGHVGTVRYLLKYGADVHGRCDKTGDTVLMAASNLGHEDVLEFLTSNDFGIDINAKSKEGTECSNFDYTLSDSGGGKALYGASDKYNHRFMHTLMPVRRNHNGDTALHRAACLSSLKALKILLDSPKTNIRERTLSGDTVLIVAIRDGVPALATEIIRLLLERDPELAGLCNNVGKSALDFCLERTPNEDTAHLEALLRYSNHNIVGLNWKNWDSQVKQWKERDWYSQLQSILRKPTSDYSWPINPQWNVLSASEDRPLEVNPETPESPYIRLQLPPPEMLRILRVHRIIFRIVSNDQGKWNHIQTLENE